MKIIRLAVLAAALSLGGCAGTLVPAVEICATTPGCSMTGTHVEVLLPLGNEAFDSGGMDNIAALSAKVPGVTKVTIFDYYQTQDVVNDIDADPSAVKHIIIGFSCGANASPVVAAGTARKVYVFVIQVSEWCGITPLTGNVVRAQETYNPDCFDTGGLGCGRLVSGPNFNPSNLTFIERPDCHVCSDHDPDAINDIIGAIKTVASPLASRRFGAAIGPRVPGAINVITRYRGQPAY